MKSGTCPSISGETLVSSFDFSSAID